MADSGLTTNDKSFWCPNCHSENIQPKFTQEFICNSCGHHIQVTKDAICDLTALETKGMAAMLHEVKCPFCSAIHIVKHRQTECMCATSDKGCGKLFHITYSRDSVYVHTPQEQVVLCHVCDDYFVVNKAVVGWQCPNCQASVKRSARPGVFIANTEPTAGKKFDQDKLRWDLFPAESIEPIIQVLMFGAEKYDAYNWTKGIAYSRLFAALMRHMWAWWRGETNDSETGLNHLAHAGCCLLFLLSYTQNQPEFDDRPEHYKKEKENVNKS